MPPILRYAAALAVVATVFFIGGAAVFAQTSSTFDQHRMIGTTATPPDSSNGLLGYASNYSE